MRKSRTTARLLVGGLLGGVLDEGHDREEAGDDHARVCAPVLLVLAVVVLVLVVQRLLRVRQRVVIVLARLGVAKDLRVRAATWNSPSHRVRVSSCWAAPAIANSAVPDDRL